MHIKLLYRKVLYVFLSVMLVFANTQTAFASAWALQSATTAGSSAIITAARDGLTSAVRHAPSAASVGRALALGGAGALALAVPQVLGSAVDWVMDSENNRVKYRTPPDGTTFGYTFEYGQGAGQYFSSSTLACQYRFPGGSTNNTPKFTHIADGVCWYTKYGRDPVADSEPVIYVPEDPDSIEWSYKPLSDFVPKVISNAANGDTASQELIKNAAVADFNTGALDNALQENAGTKPIDPTDPTSPDQSTPFDPSSLISAMNSVRSAVDNMATALKRKIDTLLVELGVMQQETNQVINDGMADVVAANQATEAKVGDVVAAIEGLEGNTLDGQVINDAVDRAIAAGDVNAADIVAAIEGLEGNTLDGQVINDAVDRVLTNDNVNAQATQDVISNSIDDAIAESHVDADTVADAVTDSATATQEAIQEQTDALTKTNPDTGETSLALPSFCGWAGTVCEYMDWVKGEYQTTMDWFKAEPAPTPAEPVAVIDDVDIGNWQEKANAGYVQFGGQCPTDVNIPINYMGASTNLSISYAPFCQFASMIKPAVILGAWISAMLIISGGRARES